MKLLILLAVLLLTGCASMPENQKIIEINFVPKEQMGSYCSIMALGCAFPDGDVCKIYVPKPEEYGPTLTAGQSRYDMAVIGHEVLHCYGWEHERI